jgi:hypothetical protein
MKLAYILLALILVGCASADVRPHKYTYPPAYLQNFPLGSLDETALVARLGPPDSTVTVGGRQMYVYKPNSVVNSISYSFIFENGVVSDVLYTERGTLNGITAKQEQGR